MARRCRQARTPDGFGLCGGKPSNKFAYNVMSFTRHVVDAALTRLPEGLGDLTMRDVTAWVPDKAGHDACLADLRFDRVKELFGGLPPSHVSAWTCTLATQLSAAEIDTAIRAGPRAAMMGYWGLIDQRPASPLGSGDLPASPQEPVLPARPPDPDFWPCPPSVRDLYAAVQDNAP